MFNQLAIPIADVRLRSPSRHVDMRGAFIEVSRAGSHSQAPVQWSVISSNSNVLRGVHVHVHHVDHVLVLEGRVLLGLCDLRDESATYQNGCLIELHEEALTAVEIPPGVAHGFYFPCANKLLHGASEYFDPADDLECRWNDPGLNIPWPELEPILSSRDQQSRSLVELLPLLRRQRAQLNSRRQVA